MKKLTFLLSAMLCLAFTTQVNAGCDFILDMTDSYGDGWNGNSVDVFVNGVLVIDDATVPGGSSAQVIFNVSEGDIITTQFNATGSYIYETEYSIVNNGLVAIGTFEDGASSPTPIVCTEAAGCNYTLEMLDSYGDGWNGNSVDVLVNGVVVLDDASFGSGYSSTLPFSAPEFGIVTCEWNGGGSYGYETTYRILDGGAEVGFGDENDILGAMVVECVAPPEIPDNDICATAESIECGDVKTGDTTFASTDSTLNFCGTTLTTGPGVWYEFMGTGDQIDVTIDTNGSDFDTKLGVFSGSCNALVCVAGNDDGGIGLQSQVNFLSDLGTTYYIYVTAYSDNSGEYTLSLACAVQVEIDNDCNTVYYGWDAESSATLTATASYGDGTYSYLWSTGETTASITVSPAFTTVYTVIASSGGGSATAETTVVSVDVTCGNNLNKVVLCHRNYGNNGDNTICVSQSSVQEHLNHGDKLGECGSLTCSTVPGCPFNLKPEDGSIGVLEDQTITWDAAPGYVAGYVVSIGTTVSGGELFDNFDVGNVLFFDLPTLDFSTTYYVSVTAYNALGEGQDCSESSRASFTVRDIPVPDNNGCANAEEIGCGTVLNADTTYASDFGAPDYCGLFANGNTGIWYTLLGDGSDVEIDLSGSLYDTRITVYTGNCGNLTCHANDDDGGTGLDSLVEFSTDAGTTYYVYVFGYANATGVLQMNVTCTDPPEELTNDDCVTAKEINCGETVTGNTELGTDTNEFCGTGSVNQGIWYTFVGDGGSYTASTCNQADFDTKIQVFSGSCGALSCVGGNDDNFGAGCGGNTSLLTFGTTNGTTYYIHVGGWSTADGTFDLSLTGDCSSGSRLAPEFSVYPNPSKSSNVTLDLREYQNLDLDIQVLDFTGKVINREEILNLSRPTHSMELNNAVNGMYFVRVQTDRGVSVKKLIIAY